MAENDNIRISELTIGEPHHSINFKGRTQFLHLLIWCVPTVLFLFMYITHSYSTNFVAT